MVENRSGGIPLLFAICYSRSAAVLLNSEQSFQPAQSEFTAQGHYLARRINGLGTSFRTFEGAVATPDAMFSVCQTQEMLYLGRVCCLVSGLINCGQARWSNKFVIGGHG